MPPGLCSASAGSKLECFYTQYLVLYHHQRESENEHQSCEGPRMSSGTQGTCPLSRKQPTCKKCGRKSQPWSIPRVAVPPSRSCRGRSCTHGVALQTDRYPRAQPGETSGSGTGAACTRTPRRASKVGGLDARRSKCLPEKQIFHGCRQKERASRLAIK